MVSYLGDHFSMTICFYGPLFAFLQRPRRFRHFCGRFSRTVVFLVEIRSYMCWNSTSFHLRFSSVLCFRWVRVIVES